MKKQDNKIKLIIGILLLLILISVSTYAYFMVGTTNNFGTKTITGKFDNTGNVTLSTGSNLTLNLTNEQMLEKTSDVTYYASSTGAKTEETVENIGSAQVVGEGTYNCTYKIKVEDKSTDSMYTTFQGMDNKSEGQIVLTVNGKTYDFNTNNLFPLTINGFFPNLTKDTSQNITASFKIVNKKEIDQSILVNADINLSFTVEEFTCTNHELDAEVLATSGELWQSGLEGDGYRYTGINPNNYICFGTTNKDTCTGNTDAHMYRIIGVFESDGKKYMKLIKKESLVQITDGVEKGYEWHNDITTDTNWNASTLYNIINGSLYLTNDTYMPTEGTKSWSNRISSWTWNSVNTQKFSNSGPNYRTITVKDIYLDEMDKTGAPTGGVHGTTPDTKIGLMYASDYLLALGTEASLEYNSQANQADFKENWMHISNNDSGAPLMYEWTISRYGDSNGKYGAWNVSLAGFVAYNGVTNKYSIRPTFYLNSNEIITSGSGTLSDPYILDN